MAETTLIYPHQLFANHPAVRRGCEIRLIEDPLFFGNDPQTWPARTTVEARLPRKDFLLEIECVAEVE